MSDTTTEIPDDKTINKIIKFSGSEKNLLEVFNTTEESFKEDIKDYYNSTLEWLSKDYTFNPESSFIKQILIEMTSNILRSRAVRQNMNIIDTGEDGAEFNISQAINSVFTDDIEKRLKPFKKKKKFRVFSI